MKSQTLFNRDFVQSYIKNYNINTKEFERLS